MSTDDKCSVVSHCSDKNKSCPTALCSVFVSHPPLLRPYAASSKIHLRSPYQSSPNLWLVNGYEPLCMTSRLTPDDYSSRIERLGTREGHFSERHHCRPLTECDFMSHKQQINVEVIAADFEVILRWSNYSVLPTF